MADLLAKRGDLDGLRARADTGDDHAATRLADLLAKHGDLDELQARADTGDEHAAWQLADLLAKHGDLDELEPCADTGDRFPTPCGWPTCWPSTATWMSSKPAPTPAIWMPPGS